MGRGAQVLVEVRFTLATREARWKEEKAQPTITPKSWPVSCCAAVGCAKVGVGGSQTCCVPTQLRCMEHVLLCRRQRRDG